MGDPDLIADPPLIDSYLPKQALKGMARTFRVTSSDIVKTAADHRLPSTDSVYTLLKWVERHFMGRKARANSLTYRPNKGDGVQMQMSLEVATTANSLDV